MNFKPKHFNPQELFINDGVLPFDENLQLSAGKLLWKAKNNLLPSTVNSLFQKRNQNNSFHLPFKRLEISQQSSTYKGVQVWNSLPESIKSNKKLCTFKTNLKKHLISSIVM